MYYDFHNKNNGYLCITSLFFVLGLIYFAIFSKKNKGECVLSAILLITFIASYWFWSNPIRHSYSHIIDGIIAKISIFSFIFYTLIFKKMDNATFISYIAIMIGLIIFYYYSNLYSSMDWCSDEHIFWHSFMHLSGFIGSVYAFYPA